MNTMMTRPNIFEHMKQFLDTYSKTTNYMLQELKSNGIIYNSYFDSKKKAQIYAKSICDESSTIYIYKSYCMKIYDPVDNMDDEPVDNIDDEPVDNIDENYDPEMDFTNMTLWTYGNGYLLEPNEDSEYFGEKYFHEGWWVESQNGWFFKDEHYQWLIDHGVVLSTDDDTMETDVEYTDVNLSNMKHGSYGTDLSKMSLEEYGKGYILKTTKKDTLYGDKYFMDGFWNKGQKGWFFKSDYFDELINMGAKYIKTEEEQENILYNSTELSSSITNDSFEYVYDDNEFMTNEDRVVPKFNKYGKGWILKADNNYKYSKGLEYFEGGWWIPSIKGWFFKSSQKKEFMKKHFEI